MGDVSALTLTLISVSVSDRSAAIAKLALTALPMMASNIARRLKNIIHGKSISKSDVTRASSVL